MQVGILSQGRLSATKKVHHMLGGHGASEDIKSKIEWVQECYDELKQKVNRYGTNAFGYYSKIPMDKKNAITQNAEDEQVQALVDGKKVFSAGGQYTTIGMQLLGSHAIIRAQKIQVG